MTLKNTVFSTILVCTFLSALLSGPAFAERAAHPAAADGRIKFLTYHENDVYHLEGSYGFSTAIEFAPQEKIETVSIGDSESWQISKPSRSNILFIKPLEPDAQTNMTVLTSRHMYSFEMAASFKNSAQTDELSYRLKFLYPDETILTINPAKDMKDGFKSSGNIPAWNFDYSYSGLKRLRPVRVFDDGTFTYFQFQTSGIMPAVFSVDESGNESLVNFSMQGPYLVASGIGRQFTLRDGNETLCIFNDGYKSSGGSQNTVTAMEIIKEKPRAGNIPVPPHLPAFRQAEYKDHNISLAAFFKKTGIQAASATSLND